MRQLSWVSILTVLIVARSYSQSGSQVAPSPTPQPNAAETLPSAPGFQAAEQAQNKPDPCLSSAAQAPASESDSAAQARRPCAANPENPYKRFLDNGKPIPLTPRQKGYLAFHDVIDPFNLLTIAANSAFTVGINSHSAYGPGMRGFGKNIGYSFSQDATGEFIGTYAICSLLHEDPHYHRMPAGRPFERVVHAISRTIIAQHDNGTPMPNYEVLITYPASAEISNLYVPGVHGDGPSTVARILTGLATDPINNIITEFLPDFAKRFHVRIVFLQQIINQVASNP